MTIIKALIDVFTAVLRSATTTFLLIASVGLTALVVLAAVGFFGAGLTGYLGLRLSRRRSDRQP